jgi:integrase
MGQLRFALSAGNITGPPRRRRRKNSERRTREYLTKNEVELLREAARRRGRYGHRDQTMILLAYRHALRVSELVALRWDQIDFSQGHLFVIRRKRGTPSTHPLSGEELRALRKLQREQGPSRHVFMSERDAPLSEAGFRKTLARISVEARLPFPVHPHMLRHGTGIDWRTTVATPARCSSTWATGTFSILCAIPSSPPAASPAGSPIEGPRMRTQRRVEEAEREFEFARPRAESLSSMRRHRRPPD